jgi:hypothetical protein
MPDWLRAARNAGVSADFFRIERKPADPSPFERPGATGSKAIDTRQLDLFA